jgi:hypothetical protein
MTFSLNEIAAYEALEQAIGKLDMNVMDVQESHAEIYAKNARSYAANALYYYSSYQLAVSLDLKERQEIILNERLMVEREKAKAQAIEKRESHVLSLLSGLAPKASKITGSAVGMETDASMFIFHVNVGGACLVELEYNRETCRLTGELDGQYQYDEDWSALNGNRSPMQQSTAYAAVVEYLNAFAASASD